jgi:hypothetical protein
MMGVQAFDRCPGLADAKALSTKAQLVTADQGPAHTLAAHLPVKWLAQCSGFVSLTGFSVTIGRFSATLNI